MEKVSKILIIILILRAKEGALCVRSNIVATYNTYN